MFPSILFRMSAWALILGGISVIFKKLVIELLLPLNPLTQAFGTFGTLAMLFAVTGIYLYVREETGRLGFISYLAIWIGVGVGAGPDYLRNYVFPYMSKSSIQALLAQPTKLVIIISLLSLLIGVILFSITLVRSRKFSPVAIGLFLIGLTIFSFSFLVPDVVARSAQVVGEIGVIWLGYTMLTGLGKTTTVIQPDQVVRVP
jgi:hypothetical protein